jgi:hypothetical protein
MPIDLSWYIKNHIVLARYYGVIRVDDLQDINEQVIAIMDEALQPIHILMDTALIGETPNLMASKDILPSTRHPNSGWYVVCGQSTVVRMLSSIAAQANGVKIRFFDTLDEGLDFLQLHDENIPWQENPEGIQD